MKDGNKRRWFAWPDAARSPWKRRLVWGALFVLVLAGVVAWRVSRPALGKDVALEGVSREEAVRIVDTVRRGRLERAWNPKTIWTLLKKGQLGSWLGLMPSERIERVMTFTNDHKLTAPPPIPLPWPDPVWSAEVQTPKDVHHLEWRTNAWRLKYSRPKQTLNRNLGPL